MGVVNGILKAANLPMQVNRPRDEFEQKYRFEILHTRQNCNLSYGALSSGEKVIFAIAHCLFHLDNEEAGRQSAELPHLLLIDEMDAPLDSAMVKHLIKVIRDELFAQHGIKVIVTTHSPTTVPLADKGSVYRLDPSPHRLIPVDRDATVGTLSDGFVTVMPSTIFVIVEAKHDADTYQAMFNSMSKEPNSWDGAPLVFV